MLKRAFRAISRTASFGGLLLYMWAIAALSVICATALNARFDLGWGLGWSDAILGMKMLAGAVVVGVFWRAGAKVLALINDMVVDR